MSINTLANIFNYTKPSENRVGRGSIKQMPPDLTLAPFANAAYTRKPPKGYTLYRAYSEDVFVFRKDMQFVIAHRGTWSTKDLGTDFYLALGKEVGDFDKRTELTRNAIRSIRRLYPDADIRMTGHSLGGSTVNAAMRDDYINDNVSTAVLYNPGSSPLFDTTLSPKTTAMTSTSDVISAFHADQVTVDDSLTPEQRLAKTISPSAEAALALKAHSIYTFL